MKIKKLAQWVCEHISSRAKCLMMKGMIALRTVNLSRLIPSFDASVKGASHERRMSRFLKEIQINPLEILRMIAVFLRLKKINKIGLIVDRTNWKCGEKYLNFLLDLLHNLCLLLPGFVKNKFRILMYLCTLRFFIDLASPRNQNTWFCKKSIYSFKKQELDYSGMGLAYLWTKTRQS